MTNRERLELVETPNPALADLDVARTWFQNCRVSHQSCNGAYGNPLEPCVYPSRLVELTGDGVKVISSETVAQPLQYMTLSHVWGQNPENQLRLHSSRLDTFSQGLPDRELPQLFRKGVHIARYLNIRYLWIDSLCILQRSGDLQDLDTSRIDWEKEGIRMADIYSNAVCNISFLYSPDDDQKISYDPRTRKPCIIRPALDKDNGIVVVPEPSCDHDTGDWPYWNWMAPSLWPLSSRAWTFQEGLLSRRTLFYGHNNFLWECTEQLCDQSLGFIKQLARQQPPLLIASSLSKSHIRMPPTSNSPLIERNGFETWVDYICEYRRRALTVHSDRIMAFAGVAQTFAKTHRLTYLAGHFCEHMPYTLL